MNVCERNLPVVMVRPDLEGLPVVPFPSRYRVRWFQPGDQELWMTLQQASERYRSITASFFGEQFGSDPVRLGERQCFIVDSDDHPVATGTAWHGDFDGKPHGRVHWIAVHPDHRGRGLGKALLSIVCGRLRQLGHRETFLRTSTARVTAINLYRRFGFLPVSRSLEEEAAWKELEPLLEKRIGF